MSILSLGEKEKDKILIVDDLRIQKN